MEGESSRSNSFYRGSSSKNLARAVPDNGVDDELTLGGSSGFQRIVRRRISSEHGTGMLPHAANIGFSGFAGPNIFRTLAASSGRQNNYFPRQLGVSSNECRDPRCPLHSASSSTMPMPQMTFRNMGYAIPQPQYASATECVDPRCPVHSVPCATLTEMAFSTLHAPSHLRSASPTGGINPDRSLHPIPSATLPEMAFPPHLSSSTGCRNPQCPRYSIAPATMPEMAFSTPHASSTGCRNPQCPRHSATTPEMAFPTDGYEIPPVSEQVNEVHAGNEEQNVHEVIIVDDDSDEEDDEDDDDVDEEDDELYEDDYDEDEEEDELYEEDDDVDDEHVPEAHSDGEEDDELYEEDEDEHNNVLEADSDGEEDDDLYEDEDDLRLDIENMSYEEILALEEQIGNHDVGLDVPTINAHLRRQKYLSFRQPPGNGTCSICLEDYVDAADLGKLDCKHDFHFDCLRQWLKKKNTCPICKKTALSL